MFEGNPDRPSTALLAQPADGSGTAERLTTAEEGTAHWPGSWSPDGQVLSYMIQKGAGGRDWEIWTLSLLDGEYKAEPLYDGDERAYLSPEFSPDGRWLAYTSGPVGARTSMSSRFPLPVDGRGSPGRAAIGPSGLRTAANCSTDPCSRS